MTEEKENKITTTIRMPVSLHKRMTDEVQRRKYTPEKTSIDGLVQEALKAYLDSSERAGEGSNPLAGLSAEHQRTIRDIIEIYREHSRDPIYLALFNTAKLAGTNLAKSRSATPHDAKKKTPGSGSEHGRSRTGT